MVYEEYMYNTHDSVTNVYDVKQRRKEVFYFKSHVPTPTSVSLQSVAALLG
jgi:hypothetical protein